MKIFPGSSNPDLARIISRTKDFSLGIVTVSRFSNDECKIYIPDTITSKTAILQSFSIPVDIHIIEFCFIVDALTRLGAKGITAIIPWLGYSKQDRVFRPGEPLSVKVIADIIKTVKITKLITLDLHNPEIAHYFDIPVVNLSALDIFIKHFNKMNFSKKNAIVVSPDSGAKPATRKISKSLNLPQAAIEKKRDLKTGKVSILGLDKKVKGLNVLIYDDMVASGSTLLEATKYLNQKGAKSIFVAVTHNLYLPGVQQKITKSPIKEFITTDSINKPNKLTNKKLKILSVADLIASKL